MKIKAKITVNMGLYEDIRPEIEIDVPDNLQGPELAKWLHNEYHGLYTRKDEICDFCHGKNVYGGEKVVDGMHPKCRTISEFQRKDLGSSLPVKKK